MLLEQTLKCEPLAEEIAKRFYQRSDCLLVRDQLSDRT